MPQALAVPCNASFSIARVSAAAVSSRSPSAGACQSTGAYFYLFRERGECGEFRPLPRIKMRYEDVRDVLAVWRWCKVCFFGGLDSLLGVGPSTLVDSCRLECSASASWSEMTHKVFGSGSISCLSRAAYRWNRISCVYPSLQLYACKCLVL